MAAPTLELEASRRMREFTVGVSMCVPGGILVLLGPSGHGKTTVLNFIAGVLRPDQGRIRIGGRVLFDSSEDIDVPIEQRKVGYVFQDYALFPHLTVFENVAFGLRARHMRRDEVNERVNAQLQRLEIAQLAGEKPVRLSAGQRQRVALGRTLVTEPDILLLDEPLSALDMQLRGRIRGELKSLLRQFAIPTIIVTHDPLDAIALGDEITVIERGRIIQRGNYESLLSRPSTRFVADFVESNAFAGRVVARPAGAEAVVSIGQGVQVHVAEQEMDDQVLVVVHPWDIGLFPSGAAGSLRNVFDGVVRSICPLRDRVRVLVDIGVPITAEVTRPALEALDLHEGSITHVGFKATTVRVFSAPDSRAPAEPVAA
jgi:molybdate transport system ATP-binding protein